MLIGKATTEATERYAARFGALRGFYRTVQNIHVSSVGIGTYLGELDDAVSDNYTAAVLAAVRGGINFIDTSLNYRHQRSEQAIGRAIIELTAARNIDRDALTVCTKAGYLVPEAIPAEVLRDEDVAGGMHSIAPAFLRDQLDRSRVNLGIETVDVFYLHNPETQLAFVSQSEFDARVRGAFEAMEKLSAAGRIQYYGMATWDGFRQRDGLSLRTMEQIANQVAGSAHRFRFLQLPFNLAMTEAYSLGVLAEAEELGISVVASASLLQGRLLGNVPSQLAEKLGSLQTDAQRALQFVRSTPGISVALAGMGKAAHVAENLGVAAVEPLDRASFEAMYQTSI